MSSAAGAASGQLSASSGKFSQACLRFTQMWATASSSSLRSRVPARTITTPGRALFEEAMPAEYTDLFGHIDTLITKKEMGVIVERLSDNFDKATVANALDNIKALSGLRFLDLGNNNLSNITPLEELIAIGGLNLANNRITDIGPLFNMPSLTSVNLSGNLGIACEELDELQRKLGTKLILPRNCKD